MKKLAFVAGMILMLPLSVGAFTTVRWREHIKLGQTLEAAGIDILTNNQDCVDEPDAAGMYIPNRKQLVICQSQAIVNNGKTVDFSEDDLDTLRHEAHHVLQDCLDGVIDGNMQPLFSSPEARQGALSDEDVKRIRNNYQMFNEHIIQLEIETFNVANAVSAGVIAEGIERVCK